MTGVTGMTGVTRVTTEAASPFASRTMSQYPPSYFALLASEPLISTPSPSPHRLGFSLIWGLHD